jgi:protein-tyrosine phosphatase
MPNILIVCTANICRSPVAEAILRDRLNTHGLTDWQVSSAGTWASTGQPAASMSAQLLAERGLDISGHASRPVNDSMLANADLILCMEAGHVEALRVEFSEHADRIYLLSEMVGERYEINDPYGGPRIAYQQMVNEVTALVEQGLPRIIELTREKEALRLGREQS